MADRYWVGGGGGALWTNPAKWSTTSGGAGGASVPTSADNAFIDANSGTPGTISSGAGPVCLDLTISVPGWTVTLGNNNFSVYGSFILDAGTVWTNTGTITFAATTTGKTVTTNGVSLASQFDFNGAGGGWTLGSNFTSTNAATSKVTTGSLNLNGYALSVPAIDINNNATAKTLTFGGGNITVTGTGSCLAANGNGALTIADTSRINFTYSGSTAMTVTLGVKTNPWVPLLNLYFTAGTYTLNLFTSATNNNACGGLDFTGFSGTLAGIASTTGATLFGNLRFSSGMSVQQANQDFYFDAAASNQTIQITTNGKILNYATIRFASTQTGTTFQLQDNLTTGTTFTGTVYLTGGTLDLNARTFTTGSTGNFISNGTTTRNITFNGGTLVCSGAAGAFNVSGTGFTTTAGSGTGKISMVSASAKEFKGGDASYNCTVSNDGAGAMTITGSNTFTTLANGVQPTSFLFTAGTTTTVTNFNVSGTAGNLVTIGSVTAASHTLSKASGTVTSNYLSISNSTATGGAVWLAGNSSTNGGNNSGWLFLSQPMVYWVGGSGTWDTSSTTNWANSSGGAAGSGIVPTAQVSAMFDQAGAYTVTMTGALVCDNITVSAGTVSFATGTTPTLGVSGSMSLIAGTAWSSTGSISFNSTAAETITTGNTTFDCGMSFDGAGGSWQLQDNLTIATGKVLSLNYGTLDLNSTAVTTGRFNGNSLNTRTLAFGNGTITTTGTGAVWDTSTVTGLTVTGTPLAIINNNTATAITINSGALSESNSISFAFINGTYALTFLATAGYTARDVDFTGFAGTLGATSTGTIYGNLTVATGMTLTASASAMTFGATSGTKTITSNGKTVNLPITFNGVGGTWQLQDNLTVGTTRTTTLTTGTLDINGKTLTTGLFSSSSPTNTRTITTGGGQITITGNNASVIQMGSPGPLTITTLPVIFNLTYSGSTGTRTLTIGTPLADLSGFADLRISAGSDIITNTGNGRWYSADFTGFSGTWTPAGTRVTVAKDLKLVSAMTVTAAAVPLEFNGTSMTGNITTAGKTFNMPVSFIGTGSTYRLQDSMTVGSANTTTLSNGTLDLNDNQLTTGLFSSSNSNVRVLAFGSGNVAVTGNAGTVWTTDTVTNLTITGTPTVNFTYAGSTGTRTIATGVLPEGQAINVNVTAGTDIIVGPTVARNLNFTGFTGTASNGTKTIYGNLTLSSGMTVGSGGAVMNFSGTSGTQVITSNGKTLDYFMGFQGIGGSYQLADDFIVGATRTTNLANGILDLNGKTLNAGSIFATSAGTKSITFNSGTLLCPGSGATAFNNAAPSGFTTTAGSGTGVISMTAAAAKTFVGGDSSYAAALDQGGGGTLTITGDNSFSDITNSYGNTAATTITFTAGTTQYVTGISASGTVGKLLTMSSTSPGNQWTISQAAGSSTVSLVSLQDSTATGGATFTASNSIDLGGNTGWLFTSSGRYWVGGPGTWNQSGTPWALASGSGGGAPAPTAIDRVFFDAGSGTPGTVSLTGALQCLDMTVAVAGWTFATGTAPSLAVSGNISLASGTTWTASAPLTFNSTSGISNITSNGTAISSSMIFDGVGGSWQLQDTLTCNSAITLVNGNLDANGNNLSILSFSSSNVNTRTLALGSGTWTVLGSWDCTTSTNLTVTGTGVISMASLAAKSFAGGGKSWPYLDNAGAGPLTITGSNTFDTLQNTVQPTTFTLQSGSTTTVTNWLIDGTAGNPVTLNSTTPGSDATISKASGTVTVTYMIIANSDATGGATWNASITTVDGGNNSGWTFPPPTPLYWVGGSGTWDQTSTTNWSFTSGGGPGTGIVPLASTPVIFDANSGVGTVTMGGMLVCKSLTVGNAGMAFSGSAQLTTYGDLSLCTGTAWPGSGQLILGSPESNSLTTSGTVLSCDLRLDAVGSYVLQDALNLASTTTVTLANGSMDINGKSIAAGSLAAVSGTKTLTFNGGNITLSGGPNAWLNQDPSGFTMLAGSADGNIRLSGTTAQSFIGGAVTYPANLVILGSGPITIADDNTFDDIQTPGVPTTILFTANSTTTVTNFSATGTATAYLTIGSTSPGSAANISLASGTVSVSYVSLRDSTATGGAQWQALINNGNRNISNNSGWIFNSYRPPLPIITGGGISFGGGIQ